MSVDGYELGVWEPNAEAIERLRFIADRRSATIFQEAFLDAAADLDGSVVSFGQEKPDPPGPPADYPAALARLGVANRSDPSSQMLGPDQRKRALSDVQKFLNQQVIQPLRESALAASDPVERTLLMGIAELSHVFHVQSVLIGEKLNRQIAEPGVGQSDSVPDDRLKNLLATADRLISITKVTERCSQSRTTILQSRTIGSQGFPRLRHYG